MLTGSPPFDGCACIQTSAVSYIAIVSTRTMLERSVMPSCMGAIFVSMLWFDLRQSKNGARRGLSGKIYKFYQPDCEKSLWQV